ncbi:hypothetical protein ACFE04_029260 [Oxalis oulophora]
MGYSYTLSFHHNLLHRFLPSSPTVKNNNNINNNNKRSLTILVSNNNNHNHLDKFGNCLNTPLTPKSVAGKTLTTVLFNKRHHFNDAVDFHLNKLLDDRHQAFHRMLLSSHSDEASLHRRIAELKELDCQNVVEDIMYMLIVFKFSEMRVPLVPKLSSCIYNNRLEIWPAKDWELESIYDFEVLELIREHVTTVVGLQSNSSVKAGWATTEIQRLHLCQIYVASILYGYFLKSASSRLHLEHCFTLPHQQNLNLRRITSLRFIETFPYKLKNLVYGCIDKMQSVSLGQSRSTGQEQEMEQEKLKCYVTGFDPETIQRCTKLKSKEAENLIRNYSCALFGDETDEVILTSFSSLKRLVLEAVAFGSFLWETEEYVDSIYKLTEN